MTNKEKMPAGRYYIGWDAAPAEEDSGLNLLAEINSIRSSKRAE